MKKIIFAGLLTTGLMMGAFAQDTKQDKQDNLKEKDVPTAIQTSFKAEFPNATDVEWKMKEGKYKVEFEMNDIDHFASYDASGKVMSKGMKIRTSELPAAVATSVKGAYADRSIDEVYRVDKDGAVFYKVKLSGNPDTKIMYSADGQEVKDKKNPAGTDQKQQ
ncbi:PepSY-like domain-containing protein [Niastella caeni]|nr:PepSY-like domain-containing protein [Niastella caeni]